MKPVCIVSSLLLAVSPLAAAQSPPLEAFASLPAMQAPSISPDGTKLAFIAHPEFAHPFYWSSLVLTGDGTRVLHTETAWPRAVWTWAGIGALLILALAVVTRATRSRRQKARL